MQVIGMQSKGLIIERIVTLESAINKPKPVKVKRNDFEPIARYGIHKE